MRTMAVVMAALFTGTLVSAAGFDETVIKGKCAAEWPTDFFMQKGCVDLARQSWVGLPGTVAGLPGDIGANILRQCASDWPGDFFMQNGCATLQADSWRSLNN